MTSASPSSSMRCIITRTFWRKVSLGSCSKNGPVVLIREPVLAMGHPHALDLADEREQQRIGGVELGGGPRAVLGEEHGIAEQVGIRQRVDLFGVDRYSEPALDD